MTTRKPPSKPQSTTRAGVPPVLEHAWDLGAPVQHLSRLLQVGLAILVVTSLACAQDKARQRAPGLDDQSFATWRDRIRTGDAEQVWEQLPWLTAYHKGLEKAAAEGKPLLLWVMNGHPLGCT